MAFGYGIDLRKELALLLERHGWWAVLRRRLGTKKQDPYNTTTDEGIFRRTSALGSGEGFVDHFVRVRNMTLVEPAQEPTSMGTVGGSLVRFYLQHHVKPDPHDFILELAQEEASLGRSSQIQPVLPYKIAKLWDIQIVRPMRDIGGRCEFWEVFVKEATMGDLS